MCFMDISLLFITLNILVPTSDILSIIRSFNCSYQHINLFSESNDKFGKTYKDYWTCMFNVQSIFKLSILKTTLLVDAISKTLVFVKSKNISLLHNCNNPSIMSFNVKILFILAPPIKNKHIGVLGYNYFLCIPSSNINPCSSFMIFKFFHHCGI